jgi:uncharacterized RDD family membrane protein YckC
MRFRKLKKINKTKQKTKNVLVYARFSEKVKALITDLFMIYMPIMYFITYAVMGDKESFQSSQMAIFSGVVLYGVVYAYLISKSGQTPGNKAYDIKVVDSKSGETISFFRALLRFVVFLLSATFLLGLFIEFFRKDNKSLHDLVVNTTVIKEQL